ncbi:RhoGAP_domain-containing protein [Hexamita inflata]|uniref:RhoGAP domain-containing protein n=1 Tax=Hexamita inflata TaxID=28002 RepID=A0AA86N7H5_9EUKA|nr:RhoGAP domain-containing protein [Hexamita inflata]CAI9934660.1 RhoGAP domain-containing protein [Hexamita inflata]
MELSPICMLKLKQNLSNESKDSNQQQQDIISDKKKKIQEAFKLIFPQKLKIDYYQCNPVPSIVREAFYEFSIRTPIEGTFRMPPQLDIQAPINQLIDQEKPIDFKKLHTHQICATIKYYYRQMRSPLINDSTAHALRAEETFDQMMPVLHQMQNNSRDHLKYLMKQLYVLSKNEVYKMDAKNLGVVFAPNLFNYQFGDEKILQMLIENANQIQ